MVQGGHRRHPAPIRVDAMAGASADASFLHACAAVPALAIATTTPTPPPMPPSHAYSCAPRGAKTVSHTPFIQCRELCSPRFAQGHASAARVGPIERVHVPALCAWQWVLSAPWSALRRTKRTLSQASEPEPMSEPPHEPPPAHLRAPARGWRCRVGMTAAARQRDGHHECPRACEPSKREREREQK